MPILDRAEVVSTVMVKLDMAKMAFFHDFWISYYNLNIIYHLSNQRDKRCWRDFELQNLSHLQIENKFSHFESRKELYSL